VLSRASQVAPARHKDEDRNDDHKDGALHCYWEASGPPDQGQRESCATCWIASGRLLGPCSVLFLVSRAIVIVAIHVHVGSVRTAGQGGART